MNIIITGASAGIGYALAKRCSIDSTNKIIVLSRNAAVLEELASRAHHGNIISVPTDLAKYDYENLTGFIHNQGISSIDILVHNAGLLINKPFGEITGKEWEEVYRVNVFGPVQLTRSLLPFLGGEKRSHIVNISSMGGVNGSLKFPGLSAYSSSKGALCTLTECLAEEFKGNNISVNCLALGSVQTEMLTKAFPNYAASMTPDSISDFIYDFCVNGWRYFNGKILQVSTTNP